MTAAAAASPARSEASAPAAPERQSRNAPPIATPGSATQKPPRRRITSGRILPNTNAEAGTRKTRSRARPTSRPSCLPRDARRRATWPARPNARRARVRSTGKEALRSPRPALPGRVAARASRNEFTCVVLQMSPGCRAPRLLASPRARRALHALPARAALAAPGVHALGLGAPGARERSLLHLHDGGGFRRGLRGLGREGSRRGSPRRPRRVARLGACSRSAAASDGSLKPLSTRVRRAVGVDLSDEMIRRGREYCADRPNVELLRTEGTLEDLGDGEFDFVFSHIVFQHLPRKAYADRYLREAARVLKPGGILRVQVDGRLAAVLSPRSSPIPGRGSSFRPASCAPARAGGVPRDRGEGGGNAVPAGDGGEEKLKVES